MLFCLVHSCLFVVTYLCIRMFCYHLVFQLFERIGNVNANKFWNNRREFYNRQDQSNSIDKHASDTSRKGYIYQKYKHKTFCDLHFFADTAEELNGVSPKFTLVRLEFFFFFQSVVRILGKECTVDQFYDA